MAFSRYSRDRVIRGGKSRASASAVRVIRNGISRGILRFTERTLQGRERLDVLAGSIYGDSNLWWIIAAASNVGWGLQVPPGTRIVIPDRRQVLDLVG